VPVTGLAPSELLLAWSADSHDPRIADLLDLARRPGVEPAQASSLAMRRAATG
jgi:hypothetical protein